MLGVAAAPTLRFRACRPQGRQTRKRIFEAKLPRLFCIDSRKSFREPWVKKQNGFTGPPFPFLVPAKAENIGCPPSPCHVGPGLHPRAGNRRWQNARRPCGD